MTTTHSTATNTESTITLPIDEGVPKSVVNDLMWGLIRTGIKQMKRLEKQGEVINRLNEKLKSK